jgi:CRP-like cAMP-binding protein
MLILLDLMCQLYYNEDEKAVVRTTEFKKIGIRRKNISQTDFVFVKIGHWTRTVSMTHRAPPSARGETESEMPGITDYRRYEKIIASSPLFSGFAAGELESIMKCLSPSVSVVEKDGTVFSHGDRPQYVGIVLDGCVYVVYDDYWGNRSLISAAEAGDVFGEAFSCGGAETLPVSAITKRESTVLLIESAKLLEPCESICTFHVRLMKNMIKTLSVKNTEITNKIRHITPKSAKEKIMSYLSYCAEAVGSSTFDIPFDRQGMADYLSMERSALSSTLGKMRDDGLISFTKNRFTLK